MKVIYLGEDRFNADWLKTVTENQAVQGLKAGHKENTIRNAWKQANGKSKPKYDSSEKPSPKEDKAKVKKKKTED